MVSQRSLCGPGETRLLCESDNVQQLVREQFALLGVLETLCHICKEWRVR